MFQAARISLEMPQIDIGTTSRDRVIAVVTGSRAEYGHLRPILTEITNAPDLTLRLIVCGMHLSSVYGITVRQIEQDGFTISDRIETLASADSPKAISKSIAAAISGCASAFARSRPDMLLVLGDRYDMLAAAVAALSFALPVAHVYGGELTEGVIDNAIRHALTKLSHLHFVATKLYRDRVIQLGEQPDRVFITGGPGLDTIRTTKPTPRDELEQRLGLKFEPAPLLVTFHPVTLEYGETGGQVDALLAALAGVNRPIVFTYPNAEAAGMRVVSAIEAFSAHHANVRVAKTLGSADYFGMMTYSAAMVGNSSSGIIEAPSFALPVVNIGSRQRGRLRAANVIDSEPEGRAIAAAIARAVAPSFRASLGALINPFGDGHAAPRIVQILATVPLDKKLVIKTFFDLPPIAELLDPKGAIT
jgi:UDP-hydrolysing UDP-N-acetyl-D-glucosamine 2-epimerase